MVLANGKQYGTAKGLEEAIVDAWGRITPSMIQKNIKSLPKRCLADVKLDGNSVYLLDVVLDVEIDKNCSP